MLRSDHSWSLADVADYDTKACTYTVVLPDGRYKYCVEEEDLREPNYDRHHF